jgi:hypothetical protein
VLAGINTEGRVESNKEPKTGRGLRIWKREAKYKTGI